MPGAAVLASDVVNYDTNNDLNTAIGTKVVPGDLIKSIVSIAIYFVGFVCVSLIIYGGFMWALAAGAQEKITKAKNLIMYSLIGLLITASAYAIGNFIFGYFK